MRIRHADAGVVAEVGGEHADGANAAATGFGDAEGVDGTGGEQADRIRPAAGRQAGAKTGGRVGSGRQIGALTVCQATRWIDQPSRRSGTGLSSNSQRGSRRRAKGKSGGREAGRSMRRG